MFTDILYSPASAHLQETGKHIYVLRVHYNCFLEQSLVLKVIIALPAHFWVFILSNPFVNYISSGMSLVKVCKPFCSLTECSKCPFKIAAGRKKVCCKGFCKHFFFTSHFISTFISIFYWNFYLINQQNAGHM